VWCSKVKYLGIYLLAGNGFKIELMLPNRNIMDVSIIFDLW